MFHVLRFWKNGFSVDDGPLRNGQDPDDKAFLESVSKGYKHRYITIMYMNVSVCSDINVKLSIKFERFISNTIFKVHSHAFRRKY